MFIQKSMIQIDRLTELKSYFFVEQYLEQSGMSGGQFWKPRVETRSGGVVAEWWWR